MKTKSPLQKKRDLILVITLFLLMGGVFLVYRMTAFRGESASAGVYYGTEKMVTVDFDLQNVDIVSKQAVENKYYDLYGYNQFPYHDVEKNSIVLLGDYTVRGVRQLVIISYDFEKKSMQIIDEKSPNNICSKEGESTGFPLICLPNNIYVRFEQERQLEV